MSRGRCTRLKTGQQAAFLSEADGALLGHVRDVAADGRRGMRRFNDTLASGAEPFTAADHRHDERMPGVVVRRR